METKKKSYPRKRMKVSKRCEGCGKRFHPWNAVQKFCSNECKLQHVAQILRERIDTTCQHCGKDIEVKAGRVERAKLVFCSIACRVEYFTAHKAPSKRCSWCKKLFDPSMQRPGQKYCCTTCRDKAMYQRKLKKRSAQVCIDGFLAGKALDAQFDPFGAPCL